MDLIMNISNEKTKTKVKKTKKVLNINKVQKETLKIKKTKKLHDFKRKRTSVFSRSAPIVNDDRIVVPIKEAVFSVSKFSDLQLHDRLIENLKKSSFDTLTTVQSKTIPKFFTGSNLFIRSQTGSGKTLAYAVPIVELLQSVRPKLNRSNGIRALILVPTRELVMQTFETFSMLVKSFCNIVPGYVYGGANRNHEKARFRKGINILIGTPGRLLDHILHTTMCKMDQVRCLVFDEADRLLDMGFKRDITKIIEILDQQLETSSSNFESKSGTGKHIKFASDDTIHPLRNLSSKKRQTVLLSATLTQSVSDLVNLSMKQNHIFIDSIESNDKQTGGTFTKNFLILPDCVKQNYIITPTKTRLVTLTAIILNKLDELSKDCCKIFVFMATCDMVEYHEQLFKKTLQQLIDDDELVDNDELVDEPYMSSDVKFLKLHGSMTQSERKQVFDQFRKSKKSVLFCTDVAARGLDVPLADTIVHYTAPISDEDYLHRTGRTGRIERPGHSIIFLTPEEISFATHLQSRKVKIKQLKPEAVLSSISKFYKGYQFNNNSDLVNHLQHRFETLVEDNKQLHELACLAYSSWSNFYHTYPNEMRKMFEFRKCHLGHYSTSFALSEAPTKIAHFMREQRKQLKEPKTKLSSFRTHYNKNLANHETESEEIVKEPNIIREQNKRKVLHNELSVSEFGSGIIKKSKIA